MEFVESEQLIIDIDAPQTETESEQVIPYQDSLAHLWDEVHRIDFLLRAQIMRWRMSIAANKPEEMWGLLHVTDAEIISYLQAPFLPPGYIPDSLQTQLQPFWELAEAKATLIEQRLQATSQTGELRLKQLQDLFNLSLSELDVLLICLLSELDERYARMIGYLQDDVSQSLPTVELIQQILYPQLNDFQSGYALFGATAPLRRHRLLTLLNPALPLARQHLRLDDRIVAFLLGDDSLDGRLAGLVTRVDTSVSWPDLVISPEKRQQLQALANWWDANRAASNGATLFFHGSSGSGRLKAAQAFCTAVKMPLLIVDVGQALQAPILWSEVVTLCYREALLGKTAVYWANCDLLRHPEQPETNWRILQTAAQANGGLTFLAGEQPINPSQRRTEHPFFRIEFPILTYQLRTNLWQKTLTPYAQTLPPIEKLSEALANGFQFSEGQILDALTNACELALQENPTDPQLSAAIIYAACRRQSINHLVTMAQRIEPRSELTFDNLILPPAVKRQLEELRVRIRYRSRVFTELGFERRFSLGTGLIALFTGQSGTGKTMTAELLAQEQGVDLYKVDLSAVVSKYVGETEKNLSRIFAEAEDANAIIFFDEADSLFGKRGEVKESRDRWANMEINYLLQRVEEYAGTVIMTTNLRQNIDAAFLRRIHIIIEFPFPDATARFSIWQGLFPTGVKRPSDDEILLMTKRFELAGGSLKNIVVDAAFRALADTDAQPPVITLRHLVAATAREYQKLGRPITRGEFGEEFYGWVEVDVL